MYNRPNGRFFYRLNQICGIFNMCISFGYFKDFNFGTFAFFKTKLLDERIFNRTFKKFDLCI